MTGVMRLSLSSLPNSKTDLVLRDMSMTGRASFVVGGQFGSEGKGAASAWLAAELDKRGPCPFNIVTGNMGCQSGHTSVHNGVKRIAFHLPTFPLVSEKFRGFVYLNAGAVIDPEVFEKELPLYNGELFIHPFAAVVTPECREEEGRAESSHTKIASTRKGVGAALAKKITRSAQVAKDHPFLKRFVRTIDLNQALRQDQSVLVEIPQGVGLSLNHSGFYPYTTSRDCTPMAAMADAGIHPSFYGATLLVLRTYPIRVGNIVENGETIGKSGGHYPDQEEVQWEDLGVDPEITTVTKRTRRVFTFSKEQLYDAMTITRPDAILLTFCDYLDSQFYLDDIEHEILMCAQRLWLPPPRLLYQAGPTTIDISEEYSVGHI